MKVRDVQITVSFYLSDLLINLFFKECYIGTINAVFISFNLSIKSEGVLTGRQVVITQRQKQEPQRMSCHFHL